MAIGMGAALLGSAIIGGGASLIGGSKQAKAATKAADISAQDNAANREFLTANNQRIEAHLNPWMQQGLVANGALQGMLGLGGNPTAAQSAFDTFRGSTGYQFRQDEGIRALQSAFSRNLESGAAQKAALKFGQNLASDEYSNYMNLLGRQAQLGFSGASALAGVGQNFGQQIVAGNTSAADAAANARLYAGQSQASALAGLGSSFGTAAGMYAFGGRK